MAERHFINGGVDSNWGTSGNWSATEGGGGGAGVPTSSEDVYFDAGSPSCTINTEYRSCKTFNAGAYTGTLTFTNGLEVYGNCTLGSGMGIAGSQYLLLRESGAFTTNGKTISGITLWFGIDKTITLADTLTCGAMNLNYIGGTTFSGAYTINCSTISLANGTLTLSGNIVCSGTLTLSSASPVILNGASYSLSAAGINTGSSSISGTAKITLTGGTWSGASTISNNLDIAGNVTFSGTIYYGTGTMTYVSGTPTLGTSILTIVASCSLDVADITWYKITFSTATQTCTLLDNLTCSNLMAISASVTFSGEYDISANTLTTSSSPTITIVKAITVTGILTLGSGTNTLNGAYNLIVGGLTMTGAAAGTSKIRMTGGNWAGTANCGVDLEFAGNVTLTANVSFGATGKTLLYTSGSITTATRTLTVLDGSTLNCASVTWNNVTFSGAATAITLSAALNMTGTLAMSATASTTFSGAYNITCAACTISGTQTVTLSGNVTGTGVLTISDANVLNGAFTYTAAGLTMTGAISSGASAIVLSGGTWSGTANCGIDLSFAGTVAVSGTVSFGAAGKTLLYTSGTTTPAAGSILTIPASCVLNTDPISWVNITISAAATVTINSLLTATGTLTLPNAAVTFDGTDGWTVATLTNTTVSAARTATLLAAVTYTVTTLLNLTSATTTNCITLTSSDGATKTIFTLAFGANQSLSFTKATRIDSSLGQAIISQNTITTCFNWASVITAGTAVATGGESLTIAGITKNSAGTALGSCIVYLFRDNGNNTATFIAYQTSNASTGAYSFTVYPGSAYFVVAFKGGATPVMDVTDRTVTAV